MMGFLATMFAREQRSFGGAALQSAFGSQTWSGARVSPVSSLNNTAVYACVRILSETVASLPLITYKRLTPRGKERAPQHPLYAILHDAPNELMTAFEFREVLQSHLSLWGNAYADIQIDARGQVKALWPLRPDKMQAVKRDGDKLYYQYQMPSGEIKWLAGNGIWHLRGMGSDGLVGYSPITLMRQAIGLALATEEFGGRFFGNGAKPGGIIEYPGVLSDDAYKKVKKSWDKSHSGLTNAHRTAILEEGMTYKEIGIPPEDAQFLETRKFQISEIARAFRIPPHMLADLERATFSNIEQQGIGFVVHTMRPWFVRWEQSIKQNLFLKRDRAQFYSEFLVDALLRGDSTARAAYYTSMFQIGAYSQNDIREKENENPVDGGDEYFVPLNMIPSSVAAQPIASSEEGRGQKEEAPTPTLPQGERELRQGVELRGKQAALLRLRTQKRYVPLFADVAGRIVRREANDVGNQAKKQLGERSMDSFSDWLADFYREHEAFVRTQYAPLVGNYAEQIGELAAEELDQELPDIDAFREGYLDSMATRHVAKQEARLRTVMDDNVEDPLSALLAELEFWRENKAAEIAGGESVRGNNAFALAVYGMYQVTKKVWRSMGDSCPYCSQLNGKTVALDVDFISAGESIEAEGKAPLTPSRSVGHAPAHLGCDCMIVAG